MRGATRPGGTLRHQRVVDFRRGTGKCPTADRDEPTHSICRVAFRPDGENEGRMAC